MFKLIKATVEEKSDVLNLFFDGFDGVDRFDSFKISFRYSSFFTDCYNGHITSKFTNKQFTVEFNIKNKNVLYNKFY